MRRDPPRLLAWFGEGGVLVSLEHVACNLAISGLARRRVNHVVNDKAIGDRIRGVTHTLDNGSGRRKRGL